MTLRARLTATFLGVVLAPLLIGTAFVGSTVTALSQDRTRDRLAVAGGAVRAELAARCDRLTAAATAAALLGGSGRGPAASVDTGLAATVTLVDPQGNVEASAGSPPPRSWADCGGAGPLSDEAFGVRVERRDAGGRLLGYAVATAPVDASLSQALTRVSGVSVELAGTATGAYARRLDRGPGQPVALVLRLDPPPQHGLYAVLLLVVAVAGLLAVAAAWWLARTTTRPLTELAHAAERVTAGDLTVRVPVRGGDEVGSLGATFNRMTAEMRAYVRALTASRDQLRGYLALLGDTLSGTHDLGRILHVTLHTARAATSAQAGVVLLYDPTTRMLVAQCTVGSADRGGSLGSADRGGSLGSADRGGSLGSADRGGTGAPGLGGLRLKLGEGLLGAVADSGVPARGRIGPDTPLAPGEPRTGTFVAVPFAAPTPEAGEEGARGVLALYDRVGPDEFDQADVTTLTTFAAQAAVALDNVRLHEEAQRLSLTDPLTGLFNYRYLRESLRRELERAARFGRTLAVVALDLDHFKDVNDTYGHGAGDLVLVEVARRIRGVTREVDFAFRRGGEEFVILLPETDAAGGAALARRLGAVVGRTPIVTPDHRITVTVSIGVAVYPDHGGTGATVLEAADVALYAAKAAGRDACRTAPLRAAPGASRGTQPTRSVRAG